MLSAFCVAEGQLLSTCMNSFMAPGGAAWLGRSIGELCAAAEACERLALTLVPALADGRMRADGLDGAGVRRLAKELGCQSDTFMSSVPMVARQQQPQLDRED